MKFVVDAQLPRRFCEWLVAALEQIIRTNLTMITEAFRTHRFLEIGDESLVIHEGVLENLGETHGRFSAHAAAARSG